MKKDFLFKFWWAVRSSKHVFRNTFTNFFHYLRVEGATIPVSFLEGIFDQGKRRKTFGLVCFYRPTLLSLCRLLINGSFNVCFIGGCVSSFFT